MQIEAHKDPVSGRIFETPDALAEFQAEQKKAAETAARIVEICARLTALRTVVVNSMSTPSDLGALVHNTYQEVLDLLHELVELRGIKRTKVQQRTKIDVVKVEAWNFEWVPGTKWVANSGLVLECSLRVTLTSEPYYKLFCEEMPNLDFETVIAGARAGGGGSSTDDADNSYKMRYTVRLPLKSVPLMRPRLVHLIEVTEAETAHNRARCDALYAAKKSDSAIATLKEELEAAEVALHAAQRARTAVAERLDAREAELVAEFEDKMPFDRQAELVQAQAGFEGKRDVDWSDLKYFLEQ